MTGQYEAELFKAGHVPGEYQYGITTTEGNNAQPLDSIANGRMTGPDLVDDTAPDVPDVDPRDDDIGETGQSLGDADPTGPEDHPAEPE